MREANAGGHLSAKFSLFIPTGSRLVNMRATGTRELRREKARRSQPRQRIAKPHVEGFT